MPERQRQGWVTAFDPSRYLGLASMPLLFVNGTNDFAYPLDSYQRSYRLVKNRDKALELVGLETYNRYLVFFPSAWAMFDRGQCTLHRLVMVKR